jgi:hypothetical protein
MLNKKENSVKNYLVYRILLNFRAEPLLPSCLIPDFEGQEGGERMLQTSFHLFLVAVNLLECRDAFG